MKRKAFTLTLAAFCWPHWQRAATEQIRPKPQTKPPVPWKHLFLKMRIPTSSASARIFAEQRD
ncbi:hypothetical protein [Ruminococcus sp.]|uniref:hypothetical protein n=1 Tax=Ruminococcus sp. TaxID=41978 RepID=UPI00399422EF